jgi:diacylglycerol kinase (ATP)
MDVVLLHNENAGSGNWSRKELIRLVRRAHLRPRYVSRNEALEKPHLLRQGEWVIVAGGDGSVRKTVLQLLGRHIPIAILPLGTANNIARSLGLPKNPEKVVDGWRKPRLHGFDLGMASGPFGRMPFIEGVGLGLISRTMSVLADIDDASAHYLKRIKDRLHRDACVVAALAHEMNPLPIGLALDGRDASDEFLLLEVLNIRRVGPALDLAPEANHRDGRFDVVMVKAAQRRHLMSILQHRLADTKPNRKLPIRRARRLTLVPPACELRIDDGTVSLEGGETVELTVERNALQFVIPR